jgi:1-acyl-sn-glycerol-3-phosphate acyltransferase
MAYKRGDKIALFSASFLPARLMYHFTMLLVRVVDWLIFRLKIEGREHLRHLHSGLLVSNHTLVLDPGIIAHVIRPRRTYFTMLEETACIPLLGTFVRMLGAVPIPAKTSAMRILEKAVRSDLKDLPFVHVFPEGDCYLWNQQIEKFQLGAFYLACRLKLPIVPITTVLLKRSWFGRESLNFAGHTVRIPPQVKVVVGEPLYPNGRHNSSVKRAAQDLSQQVRTVMQHTIDQQEGCKDLSKGRMPRLAIQTN